MPLMVRLPSGESTRISQNVSLVDIMPTLLDIAGETIPEDLPGQSLLRIAREEANVTTRSVFSEYHHMGMIEGGFMLKQGHPSLLRITPVPNSSYWAPKSSVIGAVTILPVRKSRFG